MEYGPRTRSATINRTEPVYRSYWYESNPGLIFTDQMGTCGSIITDQMDDVVIENFKSRRASGELFNNPMTRTRTEFSSSPTSGSFNGPLDGGPEMSGAGSWNLIELYQIPSLTRKQSFSDAIGSAISSCTTDAFAKVSSESATLLVSLGELKETTRMLQQASWKLVKLYPLVKNFLTDFSYAKKKKQGKMLYTLLENSWMQMRFGWLPFVSDVKNLRKAMETVENKYFEQTFRSGVRLSSDQADTYVHTSGQQTTTFSRTLYETVNVSAGVFCRARYGGVPDTFGLTKFPQTAWELTKLSWFVDYFFDVGGLIASFVPDSLWTPKLNWVTTREKIVDEITFASISDTNWNYNFSGGRTSRITTVINRIPSVPRAYLPHLRPRMNWARDIDSFFVARQLFGPRILKNIRKVAKALRQWKS